MTRPMTFGILPGSPATKMLKNMLAGALFAGFAAGLVAVLLQFAFVNRLLLEAERYESGHVTHFSAMPSGGGHDHAAAPAAQSAQTDGHDHASHDHGAREGGIDLVRDGLSVVFSVFTYVGYGLILGALIVLARERGVPVKPGHGLLWGIAGFVTVQFAPAFGLAPELPGNAAADITLRQYWWFATVALTGFGLWQIAFGGSAARVLAGVVLIALPHLWGAPMPGEHWGSAPPELAALYAARTLAVGLVAWVVLGLGSAYFHRQDAA